MKNINIALITTIAILVMSGTAYSASQTIWGSTHRSVAATNRIPVDTSSSSGPGYNTPNDVLDVMTGDCTSSGGIVTCLKTNAVAFGGLAVLNAAPAGTLTGTTLASGVTASSLMSVGSGIALGTPASGVATNLTGTATALNIGGNAATATTATNATNTAITDDTTTNTAMNLTWVTTNTGNLPQKTTSTKLNFNPSTGALSSTSFTGAGTGLTGTAASLTAGNVTTNANLTGPVTSVGNAVASLTAHAALIGNGTGAIATVAPGSNGNVLTSNGTDWTSAAAAGGSGFSAITSGTNTTAAMVVGSGGTLGVSGSGTITATATAAQTGTGSTYATNTSPIFVTPTLGVATATSLNGNTIASASDTVALLAATQTLSAKRLVPRITTITSSATPAINTDATDDATITALATSITSFTSSLTGTPNNFDRLTIRILDNSGGPYTITWGASFVAEGVALPTTTTSGKVLTVGFIYDAVKAKWGCVSAATES